MKLSIIIPVYNVEQTLERCLESILKQKFRDYQIIIINDGSTDHSPIICNDYTERDKRIQVIHQKNGGLSSARNAGIRKAKGEYITFVDSDDYLATDTLKPIMDLLSIHHDYDILEYSVYEHYGWRNHMNILRLEDKTYTDMHQYWYHAKAYEHTYAWNKIYRRELFEKVRFPEGKKFEDVYTLPRLLELCQCVATTSLGYYYYCHNPQGITMQADGHDLNDLLNAHLQILTSESGFLLNPPTTNYYGKVLNVALDVYNATGKVPAMPPFKLVCGYYGAGKQNIKIKALNLFGMKNLCRINKLFHKLSRSNHS